MNPKTHLLSLLIMAAAAIAIMAYLVASKEYWAALGFTLLVICIVILASAESSEDQAVFRDAMDKLKADYRRQGKELEDLKARSRQWRENETKPKTTRRE